MLYRTFDPVIIFGSFVLNLFFPLRILFCLLVVFVLFVSFCFGGWVFVLFVF